MASNNTWKIPMVLAWLSLYAMCQQEYTPNTPAPSAAVATITTQEMELAKLLVKADWDGYAARLSEDYVRTDSDGQVETKNQVLADYRAGKNTLLDAIPEELEVRVFREAAILTGHLTTLVRNNGRVTTTFFRTTEVFVKRDDKWFLAGSQYTRVQK